MGSISFQAATMFGSLSDGIGVESGLALNGDELRRLLARDERGRFNEYVECDPEDWLRIESVTYEDMAEFLLYSVGRLERPRNNAGIGRLYHKYKHDSATLEVFYKLSGELTDFLNAAIADPKLKPGEKLDPSPFILRASERHGALGLDIAAELIEGFAAQLAIKATVFPNVSEWEDVAQLEDLFRTEGLETQYGRFFDQRYIDYLHRNFDDIDRINWRKFEGLTAEYFDRQGFRVELGPGRNDGGIDVRVWSAKAVPDCPPATIIQCKRQKESVSKVIVKSLYADVLDERADSGLIVTTSKLSPGARAVCVARSYPIDEAHRDTLRTWIEEMRKPGLGMVT